MDRNEAEMIARAICDEQDQRERDSKLFPSQRDLTRKFNTNLRRIGYNPNGKVSNEIQNKSDGIFCAGLILAILFVITFFLNLKFLMLICSILTISMFAALKHNEIKMSKKSKWCNKKQDTFVYDMLILMMIAFTIIAEAILFFLFG